MQDGAYKHGMYSQQLCTSFLHLSTAHFLMAQLANAFIANSAVAVNLYSWIKCRFSKEPCEHFAAGIQQYLMFTILCTLDFGTSLYNHIPKGIINIPTPLQHM